MLQRWTCPNSRTRTCRNSCKTCGTPRCTASISSLTKNVLHTPKKAELMMSMCLLESNFHGLMNQSQTLLPRARGHTHRCSLRKRHMCRGMQELSPEQCGSSSNESFRETSTRPKRTMGTRRRNGQNTTQRFQWSHSIPRGLEDLSCFTSLPILFESWSFSVLAKKRQKRRHRTNWRE